MSPEPSFNQLLREEGFIKGSNAVSSDKQEDVEKKEDNKQENNNSKWYALNWYFYQFNTFFFKTKSFFKLYFLEQSTLPRFNTICNKNFFSIKTIPKDNNCITFIKKYLRIFTIKKTPHDKINTLFIEI